MGYEVGQQARGLLQQCWSLLVYIEAHPLSTPRGAITALINDLQAWNVADMDTLAAHAADQQRIAELEAALVDCFRFSLQLSVQSRIAAAQPGSAIQTRIYEAFGEDKLVTLLAAAGALAEADTPPTVAPY